LTRGIARRDTHFRNNASLHARNPAACLMLSNSSMLIDLRLVMGRYRPSPTEWMK
jgi:hypothetical protein